MGIKGIEKVNTPNAAAIQDKTLMPQKPANQGAELPELLAGNNKNDKNVNDKPKEKRGLPWGKILLTTGLLSVCLPIAGYSLLCGIVKGRNLLNSLKITVKKSTHIKNLKKIRTNPQLFKPVSYYNPKTIEECKKLAEKLGIKLKIKGADKNDLGKLREILYNLTQCHNSSKGRTIMPKKLILESFSGSESDICGKATTYSGKIMRINRESTTDLTHVTLHELGHINDFRATASRSITCSEETDILKTLGDYATTNPQEFIAEMYSKLIQCGDKDMVLKYIPKHLIQKYRQLKGPFVPMFGFDNSYFLYSRGGL